MKQGDPHSMKTNLLLFPDDKPNPAARGIFPFAAHKRSPEVRAEMVAKTEFTKTTRHRRPEHAAKFYFQS